MNNNKLTINTEENLSKDEPDIIKAAEKGDLEGVKAAVADDPDCINALSKYGETALIIAAAEGMYSMADFLCDQPGIDISIRDFEDRPAFLYARIIGRPDIAERIMRDTAAECERLADLDDANAAAQEMADKDSAGTVTPFLPSKPTGPS